MTSSDYIELAFTDDTSLPVGLYRTMPQGHALLAGRRQADPEGPVVHRRLVVEDLGGVISIAGIDITDPDMLADFADHLKMLSFRLARQQAHPYRPGTPEGRRRDEAARVGEIWDRACQPVKVGQQVDIYSTSGGEYLGRTRIDSINKDAGVLFVHTTLVLGDSLETLSGPLVFPEDVEVVE